MKKIKGDIMMELDILRFIQSFHTPFLDQLFEMITILGESSLIISIILGIYWCIDKTSGEYVAYSLFSSLMLNNTVKNIVKAKRPIGEEGIRSLRVHTATGYSFPSGHSQAAASTYGALYLLLKKYKYSIFFILIIILVGLSRLYLGVHYPKDVVGGIIIGSLMSYITYRLFVKVENRKLLYLLTLLVFLPAIFNSSSDFARSIGGYSGFVLGIWFEMRYVNFQMSRSVFRRTMCFIIGISSLLSIKMLFSCFMVETDYAKFISNMIISFYGFGLYPYLFNKVSLRSRIN